MSCERVIEEIQNRCDDGAEMSPQAKRHVGTCGACRRFYDLCRSYPAVLKREMNREIDLEREPDFSVPADRPAKRRRFVIWAAAAALAVGVA